MHDQSYSEADRKGRNTHAVSFSFLEAPIAQYADTISIE